MDTNFNDFKNSKKDKTKLSYPYTKSEREKTNICINFIILMLILSTIWIRLVIPFNDETNRIVHSR